jgi:DNA-(apurinic or apyrimidinic site) lyase
MIELRDKLAKIMNQKIDTKTIVFAVKMFSYGARNIYDFISYPKEICIPIDSRLTALFEKYR